MWSKISILAKNDDLLKKNFFCSAESKNVFENFVERDPMLAKKYLKRPSTLITLLKNKNHENHFIDYKQEISNRLHCLLFVKIK